MASKNKQVLLLVSLMLILFLLNYSFLDSLLADFLLGEEFVNVTRVVDGDTIVVDENIKVRLLGINTPEKGEVFYEEAKKFLEENILGKEVRMEFGRDKIDKYGRTLAYVFLNGKNVNLEIVRKGFANFYFPSGKDSYYENFFEAWENCLFNEKNLCEKSEEKCSGCINLKIFDYKNEILVFENVCNFDCDLTGWRIKDEGRKDFVFENFVLKSFLEVKITNEDFGEEYVWTDTGDTLFLRDSDGKLIFWKNY